MKWVVSDIGYDAFEDAHGDRNKMIDEFLEGAFRRIGEAYNFKYCSAIIFDLWSDRLLVFDSPDGLELNRTEKIYTQLTSIPFAKYYFKKIDDAFKTHGHYTKSYDEVCDSLDELTWNAVRNSLRTGKAKAQLISFNHQPALIMLSEGNDSVAHDVISGKRVAMLGKPIEEESLQQCKCSFCIKPQNEKA